MSDFHANLQRRTGRPADRYREHCRGLFPEWSERTFATFWRAMRTIEDLEGHSAAERAIADATRPNGTLNVSRLARLADAAVMRYVGSGAAS